MKTIINKLFPFTSAKVAIINAILNCMPDSTKEIVLDRVIERQLPKFHLGHKPYTVNNRKSRVTGLLI
jgi:hypothetical protein